MSTNRFLNLVQEQLTNGFNNSSIPITMKEILNYPKNEIIFNVASGKGTSVKNVFNLISNEVEKITGTKLEVKNTPWPNGVNEIEKRNFIGSPERLKSLTGWSPNTTIEKGIFSLVSYYSKEYI